MYIRRAVLSASPQEDAAPSSSLALLPLLSLSVVGLILLFFIVRFIRRGLYFPNLAWLRGKGRGTRGRLGPSSVELLPTSFKSVPASSPSPFLTAFNLESNAGKSGNSTVLSRSSSLDALPQLSASSPSHLTSRKNPDWRAPFSLPAFFKSKNKSPHRRSRSLSTTHRTTSLSMPTSAPLSPKNYLVDVSTPGSSPMSASSDLGTHKLHPASPLIPGLPIPTTSPGKMKQSSGTQAWTFDVEDESHDIVDTQVRGTLLTAQSEVHAKSPADPLIQYDPPSPAQLLIPKRLSTANPFAGLLDSSQTFISDRPPASLSSLPLTPSFPPGIELVSLKLATVQSSPNLLDFSNDGVPAGYENKITSPTRMTQSVTFVDPTVTLDDDAAPTHDIHTETVIDSLESVSNPFDDSNAITFPAGSDDVYYSDAVYPPVEESHQPTVELTPPLQSSELPAISVPVSPSLLPSQEPAKVEKQSLTEPEPLTPSWQWNGDLSPGIPVSRSVNETSSSAAATLRGAEDKDSNLAKQEADNDLMSFDLEESARIGEAGEHRLEPVVELGIDISKETDPADTWFIEERTAVWDANWTSEKDILLHMKGFEEEADRPQEDHINVLDGLLAGSSEPIKIDVFREMVEDTAAEHSLPQDSNASETEIYSSDIHDVHETVMPYSSIPTPIVLAATPLPSTHTTPNTPLRELPSLIPAASSHTVEECPDPDIMPLPDFPPLSVAHTPISPVPVKPQSPSIHQAQTPTPPASPPPSYNSTARPSWLLRATDAPAFGIPTVTAIPPVPEVGIVAKPVVEVENKADEAECVLSMMRKDTVVEKDIERPADELSRERDEGSTMMEPLVAHALVPSSFPTSPSQSSEAPPVNVTLSPALPTSPTTNILQAHTDIPASNRIRMLRSVLDIAFTTQHRPGLGAGADPAWTIRFLMAVFGWFAILVSGDLQS